jgi:hypothetical protein
MTDDASAPIPPALMRKQLTVERLRELLAMLPDDCLVEVNAVGNLYIERAGESYGYVDFLLNGSIERYEPDTGETP